MKKSVVLFIDTSQRNTTIISISVDGKKKTIKEISEKDKAQSTLPVIEKILKLEGLNLSNLTEIKVNLGTGSFVGLRVGVTIANTLAFLLKIPVNGQAPPVFPVYK